MCPDDTSGLKELLGLGFVFDRKDIAWNIPAVDQPQDDSEWILKQSDQFSLAQLLEWDDDLRQFVPGTRGWRWGSDDFAADLADSPPYDPALYLVALSQSGDFAAMARTWRNPSGAKIGFVGAHPRYRSRGLGGTLLRHMLAQLRGRGYDSAIANIDSANAASVKMVEKFGGAQVATTWELVWYGAQ
ncbi:GNAT family N-acetyltransferase [Natronoglycomyces albus]|uniref:GNAT family N-acetyltransferase n=1 Tax=Natronoglycomyces albus TaxID=2811108 RepID=A0A895XGW8_9ACTN|nr:GNAT family N-acetyltransferase [Natronoglycomyces albus]QSB04147.1 GNAT family N-acetyltransferase [Natronoglycomyces albus]